MADYDQIVRVDCRFQSWAGNIFAPLLRQKGPVSSPSVASFRIVRVDCRFQSWAGNIPAPLLRQKGPVSSPSVASFRIASVRFQDRFTIVSSGRPSMGIVLSGKTLVRAVPYCNDVCLSLDPHNLRCVCSPSNLFLFLYTYGAIYISTQAKRRYTNACIETILLKIERLLSMCGLPAVYKDLQPVIPRS
jgi:hypothetical protein